MALNVAMDGVSFPHRHEPANGLMAEGNQMATQYDNWIEGDCGVGAADDAQAKRADADWHRADLHDAMYGNWSPGKGKASAADIADAIRRSNAYFASLRIRA